MKDCETFGMRIDRKKTKIMIIGIKGESADMKLKRADFEQVDSFKYRTSYVIEDMLCIVEININTAIEREDFDRKRKLLCGPLNNGLRKTCKSLCLE